MPDRREFLAMAAAMGLMPLPALADAAGSAPDSLNTLAAAKGMGFGSCLGGSAQWPTSPFASAGMRRLMIEQCGILVPENELKWQAVRPSATTFDFSRADALIGFAVKNGMRVRGHTLLWQKTEYFPEWLKTYDFGSNPAKEGERLLGEHVATVCAHYGPAIFTYDVVNETVDEKTGELRENVLTKAMGQAVVPYMFAAARTAAPQAKLVYNDYMSWGAWSAKHRDGVLRLLEGLKRANAPIDALGVQSHIGADANGRFTISSTDQADWRRFLDEVTGMGLDLVITEFDVDDRSLPADIATRDADVAALARDYLDMMMSYKQLQYVMAWGLVDHYSWLQYFNPRADGLAKRPLPYDDDYKPTPLRAAIADAFRAAPQRA
jgi:endo-1,4-beta-xylanase